MTKSHKYSSFLELFVLDYAKTNNHTLKLTKQYMLKSEPKNL